MNIRIFTDGACRGNPGEGGWAAVILLPEKNETISGFEKQTTNNRMELKAVIEALRYISKLKYRKHEIYSDSAYVVNTVKHGWLKKWRLNGWKTVKMESVKNQELWQELLELLSLLKSKNKIVKFIKVKGHSGHKFNDMADKIAKNEIFKIVEGEVRNV